MGETNNIPRKALNILIVDDDAGDRKQIKRVIRQAQLPSVCIDAAGVQEALAACERHSIDCAIVDYQLPPENGLSCISTLHERFPHMAMIMATGQGDEVVATEAMKRGATDYIRKADITAHSIRRSIESCVEKARLQRKLAEQREELEVFSRVLVHDLQSPIHTILGFGAAIRESVEAGDSQDVLVYCDAIVRGVKRMGALIDTLHSYTNADASGEFAPFEMRQVMLDTLSNLQHLIRERGASVTFGDLPAVSGTPQLVQLLQNLIGNGLKYSEAEIPSVHISAIPQEGNVWLFSVRDNGIGIPEKHLQDIFEPFHRLHGDDEYEGTGLGLATCRKIVERDGGTIWCESSEGNGTMFFFTLRGAAPAVLQEPVV